MSPAVTFPLLAIVPPAVVALAVNLGPWVVAIICAFIIAPVFVIRWMANAKAGRKEVEMLTLRAIEQWTGHKP